MKPKPERIAPVGAIVKRTEAYLQRRRMQWGAGWSDEDRKKFKRWGAEHAAERWRIVEHLPPMSDHNRGMGWAYRMESLDGSRTSYSMPWDWEAE